VDPVEVLVKLTAIGKHPVRGVAVKEATGAAFIKFAPKIDAIINGNHDLKMV
jgi:hypothetical protein